MNLWETIEDAFLAALEDGARPAREFVVRLPWDAIDRLGGRARLSTAGYTITVAAEPMTASHAPGLCEVH